MARIPTIVGEVENEGIMFIWGASPKPLGKLKMNLMMDAILGVERSNKIREKYPEPKDASDYRPYLSRLATLYIFHCPNRNVSRAIEQQQSPVFMYNFNHILSFDGWGSRYTECKTEVCHGRYASLPSFTLNLTDCFCALHSELPFLFQAATLVGFQPTPAETQMSHQLATAWTNFAHTSDPNQGPNPLRVAWPHFSAATHDSVYQLAAPTNGVLNNFEDDDCTFFDSLGYDL